jgi:hypothetical protein
MGNPSKRDSAARKVVAAARSIVTYQIGLPEGCRRMSRALGWLAPYETGLPTVFEDYLKEVRLLPTGSERLSWNRKILQERDIALETANQRFRNQIFDSCWTLIERFAETSPSGSLGGQDRTSVSRYDTQRQEQIRVHILRTARQLIAGEIGVIAASLDLGYLRHEVEPQLANVLVTFTGIDSETDAIPVGHVRREWSPDALKRKDKEISEAEDFYRESAINAATELIQLLETRF